MKILFAYFDFIPRNSQPLTFHLHDECPINLSTEYNFSVKRKSVLRDSKEDYQYTVSQEMKPECERLPKDFWGDRIYNISAIVGDNGSGKSTLLHSILKAVVMGLDPKVPFALVLQATKPNKLFLYCSNDTEFIWNGQRSINITSDYPQALMKVKCMLLDNTLSLSSFQLSNEYNDYISRNEFYQQSDREPQKQLYNKSLISSIQFDNYMSTEANQDIKLPVNSVFTNHFSYGSFQEIRFLFDEYCQDTLRVLGKQGFPIPRSKHIYVSIMDARKLYNASTWSEKITPIETFSDIFQSLNFLEKIVINAIINLYAYIDSSLFNILPLKSFYRNHFDYNNITTAEKMAENAIRFIDYIEKELKTYPVEHFTLRPWRTFFSLILKKAEILSSMFQSSSPVLSTMSDEQYMLDVEDITSNPHKQECMICFLDTYRSICDPHYFLTFYSGLSSGEKNILRMLTQFRYMLMGPTLFPLGNGGLYLENKFADSIHTCNTLFLFLDEIDLTYHVEWQRIIISMLTIVLPAMFRNPYYNHEGGCYDIQIIITTHSPLILGDFPKASVMYLKNNKHINQSIQSSTFGENLYTILKDGFFMNDTIGEFAKRRINSIVDWCCAVKDYLQQKDKNNQQKTELSDAFLKQYAIMQQLPPGILQNKLILELNECARRLGIQYPEEKQDDPVILKKRIEELENQLDLERKQHKEE